MNVRTLNSDCTLGGSEHGSPAISLVVTGARKAELEPESLKPEVETRCGMNVPEARGVRRT